MEATAEPFCASPRRDAGSDRECEIKTVDVSSSSVWGGSIWQQSPDLAQPKPWQKLQCLPFRDSLVCTRRREGDFEQPHAADFGFNFDDGIQTALGSNKLEGSIFSEESFANRSSVPSLSPIPQDSELENSEDLRAIIADMNWQVRVRSVCIFCD